MTRRPWSRGTVLIVLSALATAACNGGGTRPRPYLSQEAGLPKTDRLSIRSASFRLVTPVQREVAVMERGKIYLVGGLDGGERSVAGVYAMDTVSGASTRLGNMPRAFHDATGAVIEDRLIVFGGGANESSSDAVQAFDVTSRAGSVISHLPKPLSDLSSAAVGDTIYLVGGYDGSAPQSTIYATVDATHFRTAGHLPVGLRYTAVAAWGADLLIAGGVTSRGPVASIFLFDTKAGRVSHLGGLPAPVGHAAAFNLHGTVYVAGGIDASGNAVRWVTAVDIDARSIVSLRPMRGGVSDAGVASDGTTAWLLGGWRGDALTQVLRATAGTE